ncbi:MAG: hypothetical protein Q9218_005459, partial [Villophora microphyllina]
IFKGWTHDNEDDEVQYHIHGSATEKELVDVYAVARHAYIPEGVDWSTMSSQKTVSGGQGRGCKVTVENGEVHTIGTDRPGQRRLRSK